MVSYCSGVEELTLCLITVSFISVLCFYLDHSFTFVQYLNNPKISLQKLSAFIKICGDFTSYTFWCFVKVLLVLKGNFTNFQLGSCSSVLGSTCAAWPKKSHHLDFTKQIGKNLPLDNYWSD